MPPLFLECSSEEKIKVTCAPLTAGGNPAPLDGALSGRVISGDSARVEPVTGEPNSVWIVSDDTDIGDTTIVIEADADLGEGVVLIQDTCTITITSPMAQSLGLSAGTPVPK